MARSRIDTAIERAEALGVRTYRRATPSSHGAGRHLPTKRERFTAYIDDDKSYPVASRISRKIGGPFYEAEYLAFLAGLEAGVAS